MLPLVDTAALVYDHRKYLEVDKEAARPEQNPRPALFGARS